MMPDQQNTIYQQLQRLNKEQWGYIISVISNNFNQYPFDDDSQSPAESIREILNELDQHDEQVEDRFIYRLQQIICFTYRAFYIKDREKVYWNPLEEPYTQFCRRSRVITNYQASTEHPSRDIISSWLYQQILGNNRDYA